MTERWIKWEPSPNLAKSYLIYSIMDTIDGFSVIMFDFRDRKKEIKIIFEKSVDAYRNTDESFRMKTMDEFGKSIQREVVGGAFYKVQNSSYIKWLSEQSYGVYDNSPFIHFAFITGNSILDIVARYEPRIEFINE